eukprot:g61982.t1
MAYICEFGDAMVEGTGLDGAMMVYPMLRAITFVAKKMAEEQKAQLEALSPAEEDSLSKSLALLETSEQLARMYQLSLKNPNQLIAFLRKFRAMLEALPVGGCMLVPGGFNNEAGFSPFLLALERTEEQTFSLAVINSGQGSGEYHFSSALAAPPKIQTRLVLSFDGVSRMKLLDDAWWFMFWRMGFSGAKANTPDKLYQDLLPLVLERPLEQAIRDCKYNLDDAVCPFRTNQRANVTGYRIAREAWVWWLLRHGLTPQHALQVSFAYQQQWVKLVLHDLHCVDGVVRSDLRQIRLCTKYLAHITTKKDRVSDPSRFLAEQLGSVRLTLQGHSIS